jgi:hypothetical protein
VLRIAGEAGPCRAVDGHDVDGQGRRGIVSAFAAAAQGGQDGDSYGRHEARTREEHRHHRNGSIWFERSIKASISVNRHGAFAPFVRPTPQSDPWRHDRARIVS